MGRERRAWLWKCSSAFFCGCEGVYTKEVMRCSCGGDIEDFIEEEATRPKLVVARVDKHTNKIVRKVFHLVTCRSSGR